jgi:hypothetical protein
MCTQAQANGMKADFRSAALVGDRKAVSANAVLTSVHRGEADAARSGDDDTSVVAVMSAEASYQCIAGENEGAKRMIPSRQLLEDPFPANAGKSDPGVHLRETFGPETGISDRREAGVCYRGDRAVDAKPGCSRTGRAGAEITPAFIFYPGTTVRSPAIDAYEETRRKRFTSHARQTALRSDHAALPHDQVNPILISG